MREALVTMKLAVGRMGRVYDMYTYRDGKIEVMTQYIAGKENVKLIEILKD